jgi:hypothetical protein
MLRDLADAVLAALDEPAVEVAAPTVDNSLDGDWDAFDKATRGSGHFYRIIGEAVCNIDYGTFETSKSVLNFRNAKTRIGRREWSRLTDSELAAFTAEAKGEPPATKANELPAAVKTEIHAPASVSPPPSTQTHGASDASSPCPGSQFAIPEGWERDGEPREPAGSDVFMGAFGNISTMYEGVFLTDIIDDRRRIILRPVAAPSKSAEPPTAVPLAAAGEQDAPPYLFTDDEPSVKIVPGLRLWAIGKLYSEPFDCGIVNYVNNDCLIVTGDRSWYASVDFPLFAHSANAEAALRKANGEGEKDNDVGCLAVIACRHCGAFPNKDGAIDHTDNCAVAVANGCSRTYVGRSRDKRLREAAANLLGAPGDREQIRVNIPKWMLGPFDELCSALDDQKSPTAPSSPPSDAGDAVEELIKAAERLADVESLPAEEYERKYAIVSPAQEEYLAISNARAAIARVREQQAKTQSIACEQCGRYLPVVHGWYCSECNEMNRSNGAVAGISIVEPANDQVQWWGLQDRKTGEWFSYFPHGANVSTDRLRVEHFYSWFPESERKRYEVRALVSAPMPMPDEVQRLSAFKAYVHKRLDEAGIPHDPESPHKADGCRIGGRLDIALGDRPMPDGVRRLYEAAESYHEMVISCGGWFSKLGKELIAGIAAARRFFTSNTKMIAVDAENGVGKIAVMPLPTGLPRESDNDLHNMEWEAWRLLNGDGFDVTDEIRLKAARLLVEIVDRSRATAAKDGAK